MFRLRANVTRPTSTGLLQFLGVQPFAEQEPRNPKAFTPDKPLLYKFALPKVSSVRVWAQNHGVGAVKLVSDIRQKSQTFVPNIFWAKPGDYKKAVEKVYHSPDEASFIELPVVVMK